MAVSAKNLSRVARRVLAEALEGRTLLSATWYVAANTGSDSNAGTSLNAPFQTISAAAAVAQPGDTVLVRAGTYHETVTPAHTGTASAPITYEPYNNENATISGLDPLTGWTNTSGNVYQASQPTTVPAGNNPAMGDVSDRDQLLVDGMPMTLARWPNMAAGSDASHPTKAIAGSTSVNGSTVTLYDAHLNGYAAGYWAGATIDITPGNAWFGQTGIVTASTGGSVTFTYTNSSSQEVPAAGNTYYLTGTFKALDAAGEFYRDPTTGQTYLWTPAGDSPANHDVEVQTRTMAFNLAGISYTNVLGFNVLGAKIETDAASSHLVLDGLSIQHAEQFVGFTNSRLATDEGAIDALGSSITIENCTIGDTAGDGMYVQGSNNSIVNNIVHDTDTSGGASSGIRATNGVGTLITGNTVYNTGREGITLSGTVNATATHNLVHDVGLQTTDNGAIYSYGTASANTEIAENYLYNATGYAGNNQANGTGIYLDSNDSGYHIHNNVAFNVDIGLRLNPTSANNTIVSNTLLGNTRAVASYGSTPMNGDVLENNIFHGTFAITRGAAVDHNLSTENTDPLFANVAAGNYTLGAGSPAIDAGTAAATNGAPYGGTAPDEGAYEHGLAAWTYGAVPAAPAGAAPLTPTNLTATPSAVGATTPSVALAWTGDPSDIYGYTVQRSTDAGATWVDYASVSTGVTSYADSAVTAGQAYSYRLRATNPAAATPTYTASATATVAVLPTTNLALNRPAVASSVERSTYPASAAVDGNSSTRWSSAWADGQWLRVDLGRDYAISEVKISWQSAYAKAYQLQLSDDASNWTTIYSTATSAGGNQDLKNLTGVGRYLRILCVTRATAYGVSLYDVQAFGIAAAPTTPTTPAAPTNLTTGVLAGNAGIALNWTDNASNEADYVIQRSTDGGVDFADYATLPANTTTYTDGSITAGDSYVYQVRAVAQVGAADSSYSNAASQTVPGSVAPYDVAKGKAATASSIESSAYPAANATDGNSTTRWSTAWSDNQWLQVDLGQTYTISEVKLNWQSAYGKAYQIQVSRDGTNWTTIYSTTTSRGGINDITGLNASGRYVRMQGIQRGTAYGYSLWDFNVYGY